MEQSHNLRQQVSYQPHHSSLASSPRPQSLKRSRYKMSEYLPSTGGRRYSSNNGEAGASASNYPPPPPPPPPHPVFPRPSLDMRTSFRQQLPPPLQNRHREQSVRLPPIYDSSYQSPQDEIIRFNELERLRSDRREAQEVIDLTGSDDAEPPPRLSSSPVFQTARPLPSSQRATRLPRFSADVINIEDSPPQASSRRLEAPPSGNAQQGPYQPIGNLSDNNDVEILFSRPRIDHFGGWQGEQPGVNGSGGSSSSSSHQMPSRPPRSWPHHRMDQILTRADRRQALGSHYHDAAARNPSGTHYSARVRSHVSRRRNQPQPFVLPSTLDYTATGFSMFGYSIGGGGGGGANLEASPPPAVRPAHEELAPAKEGFTRSPQEEDLLVCPNCLQELGTGEGDVKAKVSVIRGCGHVYCGECAPKIRKRIGTRGRPSKAAAAAAASSGKGKGVEDVQSSLANGGSSSSNIKPITKCVVEGCGKRAAASDVIAVYL